MNETALIEAFEQSIQMLNAGNSVEDCLRTFPDLADQLAPMLEVGEVVNRSRLPSMELMAAKDRVRFKMQARQRKSNQASVWVRATAAVAVIAVASVVALKSQDISAVLNRMSAGSTSTPSPSAMPTNTEAASPTMRLSATWTATPSPISSPTPALTESATKTIESRQPIIQLTGMAPTTDTTISTPVRAPSTAIPSPATLVPPPAPTSIDPTVEATDDSSGGNSGTSGSETSDSSGSSGGSNSGSDSSGKGSGSGGGSDNSLKPTEKP